MYITLHIQLLHLYLKKKPCLFVHIFIPEGFCLRSCWFEPSSASNSGFLQKNGIKATAIFGADVAELKSTMESLYE